MRLIPVASQKSAAKDSPQFASTPMRGVISQIPDCTLSVKLQKKEAKKERGGECVFSVVRANGQGLMVVLSAESRGTHPVAVAQAESE